MEPAPASALMDTGGIRLTRAVISTAQPSTTPTVTTALKNVCQSQDIAGTEKLRLLSGTARSSPMPQPLTPTTLTTVYANRAGPTTPTLTPVTLTVPTLTTPRAAHLILMVPANAPATITGRGPFFNASVKAQTRTLASALGLVLEFHSDYSHLVDSLSWHGRCGQLRLL